MRAFLVFAVGGPVLILTNLRREQRSALVERLSRYGKFIAFEVPFDMVKTMYSAHLEHVMKDPMYTDDFRVLDSDGKEIFTNIEFTALKQPLVYEPGQ